MMTGTDTSSLLHHILTHTSTDIENVIYGTPIGKSDHIISKFDYESNEDRIDQMWQNLKGKYNQRYYTEFKLYGNIWKWN